MRIDSGEMTATNENAVTDTLIDDATATTERKNAEIATPGTGTTETNPRSMSNAERTGDKGTGISDGIKSVDFSDGRNVGRPQGMTNRYRHQRTEKTRRTAEGCPFLKRGKKENPVPLTGFTVITAERRGITVINAQAKQATSSRQSTW
jgi:hypothetical protein